MRLYFAILLAGLCVALFGGLSRSIAQTVANEDLNQDQIDPAGIRRFWIGDVFPAAPSYVLTSQERERFSGTFGIDLSHYSFDIDHNNPIC